MRKRYNDKNSTSNNYHYCEKQQSPCYSPHHRYVRRDSISSKGSSGFESETDDYTFPHIEYREHLDFYIESINSVDPLQKEFSKWAYIQSMIPLDDIKLRINKAHRLKKKIEYYICRLDKEKKNNILIKFKEEIDENELTELKSEFANTYSYVYFPQDRFDLILDYMNSKAEINTEFIIINVQSICDLNIVKILSMKQIARNLVNSNAKLGYNTTSKMIIDKLIRTYLDENLTSGKVIDLSDLMDKFGLYGYKFLTMYSNIK